MNLMLNARDAMPEGGRLTVETERRHLDCEALHALGTLVANCEPGTYALLRVTDQGHGIPADVLTQIFEPFYTTKGPGKGTGLGLSTVFGIAQQHGGFVRVAHTSPEGTTFEFGVPSDDGPVALSATPVPARPPKREGRGTILVVEDDVTVRRMMERVLVNDAWTVLTAESGREALDRWDAYPHVDVLLTDLVMPGGVSGTQLARALRARRPALPVVYTSGYDPDAENNRGLFTPGVNFIQKPASLEQIRRIVREQAARSAEYAGAS